MLTRWSFTGAQYENSSEIGVFSRLTNAYCILAEGNGPLVPRVRCHGDRRRVPLFPFFFSVAQVAPNSTD